MERHFITQILHFVFFFFFVLFLWSMYILFSSHSPLFKCIRSTLKKFHFAFRLLTLLGTAHRNVTIAEVVSQL